MSVFRSIDGVSFSIKEDKTEKKIIIPYSSLSYCIQIDNWYAKFVLKDGTSFISRCRISD